MLLPNEPTGWPEGFPPAWQGRLRAAFEQQGGALPRWEAWLELDLNPALRFADSLLPVLDSLEAGLAIQSATPEQIREGAEATLRQLKSALERHKVIEINPEAGAKFDPHQHQAISVVPAEQEPNTVVAVLQKGYAIAERVLRPALVTVAAPK